MTRSAISITLAVLLRRRRDGLLVAEAALVPGSRRCGDDADELVMAVATLAARAIGERLTGAHEILEYLVAQPPEVRWIAVELEPGGRDPAWERTLTLQTPAVVWRHGAHLRAWLPAAGVDVVVEDGARLETACREQALASLERARRSRDLRAALALAEDDEATVRMVRVAVDLPHGAAEEVDADLAELRHACTPVEGSPATGLEGVVERLAGCVGARAPRGVLLVGPSGVGKTAAVRELARRAGQLGLEERPLLATSGARLVAGMSGHGMWQERCVRLRRALAVTRAILHLGSLRELVEVGRSEHNQQGIGDFLRPWLASGEIVAIAEATPEELAALEAHHPALVAAFERIPVPEPDEAVTGAVLAAWSARAGLAVDGDAIAAVVSLHRRFAAYSAAPGRPLRFVADLSRARPGERIDRGAVMAAFARASGMPALLIDERVPLDLERAHAWFAARILGQEAAVRRVVDLLAVIKAGLARRDRPLASLLFAGPTGVGKTETAKALAEHLYGDRGRLVRFDMSEHADPAGAMRLVGFAGGAMGLLVARARREPFSVILLDEIEKAHPLAFDLLLQALGEGRITDGSGRTADLRSSVVVMTSNLGVAEGGRDAIGFSPSAGAREQRVQSAIADHFRPEFINRLDGVVVFAPLSPDIARGLAQRELAALARRDGLVDRGLLLETGAEVVERLAAPDAAGARGLKRRVERAAAMPLAAVLARAELRRGDVLTLRAGAGADGIEVAVQAAGRTEHGADASAIAAAASRRFVQRIDRSPALRALRAERARGATELKRSRRARQPRSPAELAQVVERVRVLDAWLGDVEALREEVLRCEVAHLVPAVAGGPPGDAAELARLARESEALLEQLWRLEHPRQDPDRCLLGLVADSPKALQRLALGYLGAIAAVGDSARVHLAIREGAAWHCERATGRAKSLDEPPESGAAVLLAISGPFSLLRWDAEAGVQSLDDGRGAARVLVATGSGDPLAWKPPAEPLRRGWLAAQKPQRAWDAGARRVEDGAGSRHWNGTHRHLVELLAAYAAGGLRRRLEAVLGDAEDGDEP